MSRLKNNKRKSKRTEIKIKSLFHRAIIVIGHSIEIMDLQSRQIDRQDKIIKMWRRTAFINSGMVVLLALINISRIWEPQIIKLLQRFF